MTGSNRNQLDRFFAAFLGGDGAGVRAVLHPDFEIHEPDSLPYGGVWRGPAGWDALIVKVMATWSDVRITHLYVIGGDDDDRFGLMSRLEGRNRAGEAFDTRVFEMLRFEDGLIREIRVHYYDTALMVRLAASAEAA